MIAVSNLKGTSVKTTTAAATGEVKPEGQNISTSNSSEQSAEDSSSSSPQGIPVENSERLTNASPSSDALSASSQQSAVSGREDCGTETSSSSQNPHQGWPQRVSAMLGFGSSANSATSSAASIETHGTPPPPQGQKKTRGVLSSLFAAVSDVISVLPKVFSMLKRVW